MKGEIQKCLNAGVPHLHFDIFDGVYLDSPNALTFGPQMVDSIRKRFIDHQEITLDIHLCVERPERYASAMADAGASRIIFQWEAMYKNGDGVANNSTLRSAVEFAKTITSLGLKCGISINPETDITTIYPLLDTGLVDIVDILAVEPGFGGQQFNNVAIEKITMLRQYIDDNVMHVKILVDGGINQHTCSLVKDAGADILVAGEMPQKSVHLHAHYLSFDDDMCLSFFGLSHTIVPL